LLSARRPAEIADFVVPVVVDAVKLQAIGAATDGSDQICRGSAKIFWHSVFDAATTVVSVFRNVRLGAATARTFKGLVLRGTLASSKPMNSSARTSGVTREAAAGAHTPVAEGHPVNSVHATAITIATPPWLIATGQILNTLARNEAAETLSGQINDGSSHI
jgi:hypothetical protein